MAAGAILSAFVVGLALVALLVYWITMFNGLVALRNEIRRAWANVDVLLKQRADEVPNLVATVQGYAAHERATLLALAEARAAMQGADGVAQKGAADARVRAAIGGAFAVAEAYPQLRADQSFLKLQARLTELESEIADRRELYNDTVTDFNNRIATFPDMLVARASALATPEPLFQAEGGARGAQPPDVSFPPAQG